MSYQKLNPNRAWIVEPSDLAPLPVFMSKVDEVPPGSMINFGDTILVFGQDLLARGVKVGDVIYGSSTSRSAIVVGVYENNGLSALQLNGDPQLDNTEGFTVYRGSNRGAVLYVGTPGAVKVLTAGNDEVSFQNVQGGSFIPVNVIKVFRIGTTAEDILALY